MAQTKIANRQISGGLDGWIPISATRLGIMMLENMQPVLTFNLTP